VSSWYTRRRWRTANKYMKDHIFICIKRLWWRMNIFTIYYPTFRHFLPFIAMYELRLERGQWNYGSKLAKPISMYTTYCKLWHLIVAFNQLTFKSSFSVTSLRSWKNSSACVSNSW